MGPFIHYVLGFRYSGRREVSMIFDDRLLGSADFSYLNPNEKIIYSYLLDKSVKEGGETFVKLSPDDRKHMAALMQTSKFTMPDFFRKAEGSGLLEIRALLPIRGDKRRTVRVYRIKTVDEVVGG